MNDVIRKLFEDDLEESGLSFEEYVEEGNMDLSFMNIVRDGIDEEVEDEVVVKVWNEFKLR